MASLANTPANELIAVLGSRMTDYNSASRPSGENWINPDWPAVDLQKNSYPRISVTKITQRGDIVNIGTGRIMEYQPWLQADIWVWAADKNPQILTISGVQYYGEKQLQLLAMDMENALDDGQADFDAKTNKLFNYQLLASVDMGLDDKRRHIMRHRIEVGYNFFRGE